MRYATEQELDMEGLTKYIKDTYGKDIKYTTFDIWDVWYAHTELPTLRRGVWYSDWVYEIGYEDGSPDILKGLDNVIECWRLL